jgi:tRNA threonylcarbamoyladenosine biosynthesis protein TsaE
MEIIKYSLPNIDCVARGLITHYIHVDTIILFNGDMGIGKTTLISAIVKNLGYKKNISSPTYSYYNEYNINEQLTIRHFDLYKIKNLKEFEELGFHELIIPHPELIIIIEWPEIIQHLLNSINKKTIITYSYCDENKREISIIRH